MTSCARRHLWLLLLFLPLLLGSGSGALRVEDFGGYWCGARLLLEGSNPYDPDAILRLEKEIEPERESPQMPWGPPWALALLAPFACLDFAAARIAFLILTVAGLAWASAGLWRLYAHGMSVNDPSLAHRANPNDARFAWLVCFSFYPVILLLAIGQVSVANPLAIAGFLILSETRADFRAGLVLSLIAAKPQVVLLFAVAALVWIVWQKRWRIFLGGACGLAVQTGVLFWFNPRVFHQYLDALSRLGPADAIQPTPGTLLQLLLGGFWPALLPLAAGVIWLAWRMVKARPWNWRGELPGLSFACLLTSPHAWIYDYGVLLVPLHKTAAAACDSGPMWRWTFLGIHAAATAAALVMNVTKQAEFDYFWLLPVYLVLYLVLGRKRAQ